MHIDIIYNLWISARSTFHRIYFVCADSSFEKQLSCSLIQLWTVTWCFVGNGVRNCWWRVVFSESRMSDNTDAANVRPDNTVIVEPVTGDVKNII